MNCRMQFFDIGLTLSQAVDYLVAPLSAISFNGYNYKEIFEAINTEPEITPKKLACVAVTSFKTKLFNNKPIRNFELKNTTLFANNLNHYFRIGEWIDKLSSRLVNIIEIRFRRMNEAREKKIETLNEDYKMVDICDFLLTMKYDKYYPLKDKDSMVIKRLIKSAIIQKYIGVPKKEETPLNVIKRSPKALSGIGVFFPKNNNDIRGNDAFNIFFMENNREASPFAKLFRWDSFITQYLKKTQNG